LAAVDPELSLGVRFAQCGEHPEDNMKQLLWVLGVIAFLSAPVSAQSGSDRDGGVKSRERTSAGEKIEFNGLSFEGGRARRDGMDGRDPASSHRSDGRALPSQLIVIAPNGSRLAVLTRPADIAAYLATHARTSELNQQMDDLKTQEAQLNSTWAPHGERQRQLEVNSFWQVRVREELNRVYSEQMRIIDAARRDNASPSAPSSTPSAAPTPAPSQTPGIPAGKREWGGGR
jgi:hypothetical protein